MNFNVELAFLMSQIERPIDLLALPLEVTNQNADLETMVRGLLLLKFKFFIIATLISLTAALNGCGKISSKISATFKDQRDFARSEIISNGPTAADGSSELLVVIQLMNSDGSAVKLFKPTYEVISGTGVTASACTTSNDNGVSTCVLKATVAGTKRISVTNITIPLQADVVFTTPQASKPVLGLASANKKQTQGNFSLSATIGNQEPGAVKTSGTYKLYGGVQGEEFSR